eukprot:6198999-Pleurochrysis_carterae.AAC.1
MMSSLQSRYITAHDRFPCASVPLRLMVTREAWALHEDGYGFIPHERRVHTLRTCTPPLLRIPALPISLLVCQE